MSDDMISRADAIGILEDEMPGHYLSKKTQIVTKLRALPAVEVGVRELEWRNFGSECIRADTVFCRYEIVWGFGSGQACLDMHGKTAWLATVEAAKADYAARIRSAMTATQAQDVAGLVRRRAAQTLWDMLHMKNGAHEGMTHDEVRDLWHSVNDEGGFSAVITFLACMKKDFPNGI